MSAKKSKNDTVIWQKCEKCGVFITSKQTASHSKYCPISPNSRDYCFIWDKSLYTNDVKGIPVPDTIIGMTSEQIAQLIFVGYSAINACGWCAGDEVMITLPDVQDLPSIIRRVFPQSVDSFSAVQFVESEFDKNWKQYQDKQLVISAITSDILPAERIQVKLLHGRQIKEEHVKDFMKYLKTSLATWLIRKGSEHSFKFFGRKYMLKIDSVTTKDFLHLMKNLDLSDGNSLFRITESTEFSLNPDPTEVQRDPAKGQNTEYIIGGMDKLIAEVRDLMNIVLEGKVSENLHRSTRGILFHGPAGCGKTLLCNHLAGSSGVKVIPINPHRIFSKYLGEAEVTLSKHFQDAYRNDPHPTVIVIDDIHLICPRSEATDAIRRVSATLLRILDELPFRKDSQRIFVLAATTDVERTNPALRRSGRLDCTMEIPVPTPAQREDILRKMFENIPNALTDEEIGKFSQVTHAFVGADLSSLVGKAIGRASQRDSPVTASDVNWALTSVTPSAMKEVQVEVPNVLWADIGGQHELKLKLKQAIEWPLTNPEVFPRFGIDPPRGVLMYGPPGCSKTMIAKALATESHLNFLTIKGPDIFSMWVGESERAVRELFRKARSVAPSIVFFDEIDAIGGERGSESGSSVKERVLAQLLTEMDGVTTLDNVTIVAATNRPDLIDRALLRPGRIDRIIYVGLPDRQTRQEIFHIKLRKMPVNEQVDVEKLVNLTENYSGAEIQAVCREAALCALEESLNATDIHWRHFEHALGVIRPRTSSALLEIYDAYEKDFLAQ
ncbi:spermatogenesis-associated protein 5 [Sergentomyia squamirostris]